MRPRRSRARHRVYHPTRLVDLTATQCALPPEEASAYLVGLSGAALIYDQFPDFYHESHIDAMPVTLLRLLGCCAAFWQLVEQRGLLLRWPGEGWGVDGLTFYNLADTPEETIGMFTDVSAEWMSDLAHFIRIPRPRYHGYGVQALVDGESDTYPDAPLTLLLWHMFQHTPLGLGVPIAPMAASIDEDLAFDLLHIKPLPSDVPLQLFGATLQLANAQAYGVSARDLVGYPFGKTTNTLANYDEYEVEAIFMGEVDEAFDWGAIDRLAQQQRAAARLEAAYADWSRHMTQLDALRNLASQLHKAARAATRALQAAPKSLITLLGDAEEEASAV